MDISEIQDAAVTKLCDGLYRLMGDGWGIDVDAPDEATAKDKAVAAFTPAEKPPAAADVVLGALEQIDPNTATIPDVINAIRLALNTAQATPLDPNTGQPLAV